MPEASTTPQPIEGAAATPQIGVIFAGQGSQHPGMGEELYRTSPAAKAVFDQADQILGWSISRCCFQGTQEELTACAVCQPAIYVASYAAFAHWQEEHPHTTPAIAGGLSLGEITAFAAAGAYTFQQGLKLVARRGELMDLQCKNHPGAMAAIIGAPEEAVQSICAEIGVDVANYNCPGQLIISGEVQAVEEAAAKLAPVAMKATRLQVAGAYHSRLMKEAGEAFRAFIAEVPIVAPRFPVVHNVTGQIADESPDAIREHLAQQIYSPVRWESCARTMATHCQSMVEFGPGNVLAGLMRRIDRKFPVTSTAL